jgi:hypothetical protein
LNRAPDEEALLIHIVYIALFNVVLLHLRMQQIKVELILIAAVSLEAIAIDPGALFGGNLVSVAMQKARNLASRDVPFRHRAAEILYRLTHWW